MISAHEALNIILDSSNPLDSTTVSLLRARGYALAEEVVAFENIPSFDNSAMDGFAVRSGDMPSVPIELRVVGEVAAGKVFAGRLNQGEALHITTGTKIPEGADAVVQVEWTEASKDERVRILRTVKPGHNIRKAGGDIAKGTKVLGEGMEIRSQEIGVLASLGRKFVEINRPARVAVLTTGNEVVEIDKPLKEGSIRNSNGYVLQSLIHGCGGEAIDLGIAKDDPVEIKSRILEGLKSDMLITSGGVSIGKYDLVGDILKELGVEIKFWKVNIKPGMPLLFGIFRGRPVFGLPGNPVSTMVTFIKFVRPALRKMMGHASLERNVTLRAVLQHEIKKTDGKRHFVRGVLENSNGSLQVQPTGSQLSNVLTSLVNANCLIIVPEEKETLPAGETVEVELLP